MLNIQQLNRDGKGLEVIKISDGKEKVFFRTSTIIELLKCEYKAKFLLDIDINYHNSFESDKYAVLGALIHELVEYLLLQDRFNLYHIGIQNINHVYNILIAKLNEKYNINLFNMIDRDKIINTSIVAASYLSNNFNITDTEKVFIFEDTNYILKITPDILTDQYILDLKTKYSKLPKSVSYEHAFQMNLYKYYLNLEPILFYIHVDTSNYISLKPGNFNNIKERLNNLANNILDKKYLSLPNQHNNNDKKINKNNCYFCKYKNICDLYKM